MKTSFTLYLCIFTLGVFIGYYYRNKQVHETPTVVTKTIENKETVSQDTKTQEVQQQKTQIVYRTITKYSSNGSIKEVINEKSDTGTKSNQILHDSSNEVSRYEANTQTTISGGLYNPSFGLGIILPYDLANDIFVRRVIPSELNYELIGTKNLTDRFSLVGSVNMESFNFKSANIGVMYQW